MSLRSGHIVPFRHIDERQRLRGFGVVSVCLWLFADVIGHALGLADVGKRVADDGLHVVFVDGGEAMRLRNLVQHISAGRLVEPALHVARDLAADIAEHCPTRIEMRDRCHQPPRRCNPGSKRAEIDDVHCSTRFGSASSLRKTTPASAVLNLMSGKHPQTSVSATSMFGSSSAMQKCATSRALARSSGGARRRLGCGFWKVMTRSRLREGNRLGYCLDASQTGLVAQALKQRRPLAGAAFAFTGVYGIGGASWSLRVFRAEARRIGRLRKAPALLCAGRW